MHRDSRFANEQPASADTRRRRGNRERRIRLGEFVSCPRFSPLPFRVSPRARSGSERVRARTKRFVTHAHLVVLTRHSTFSPTPSRTNRTRTRTAALPSTAPCVCGTRVRRRVKPFRTATCAACWTWRLRRISNPSSPRRTTTPRACSAWCRSWRENGAFRERVCLNSIHTDRLSQSLVARQKAVEKKRLRLTFVPVVQRPQPMSALSGGVTSSHNKHEKSAADYVGEFSSAPQTPARSWLSPHRARWTKTATP